MTAAKRATTKRLSLDSVAMRLAKAESMPGRNGKIFYTNFIWSHFRRNYLILFLID